MDKERSSKGVSCERMIIGGEEGRLRQCFRKGTSKQLIIATLGAQQ